MADVKLTIELPEDPAKICIGSEPRLVACFRIYIHGLAIDNIDLYKNNKEAYSLRMLWGRNDTLDLHHEVRFCTAEDKKLWIARLTHLYKGELTRTDEVKEAYRQAAREEHKPGHYCEGRDYIYREECEKIDREAKGDQT